MNRFSKYGLLALLLLQSSFLLAQTPSGAVVFNRDTLFIIQQKIGAFSPGQRADLVEKNIQNLSKLPLALFDSLKVVITETGAEIVYLEKIINSVTHADAQQEAKNPAQLAHEHLDHIRRALIQDYNDKSLPTLAKDIGLFFLALIIFMCVLTIVNKLFDYFRKNLKLLSRNLLFRNNRVIRIFELITPAMERNLLLVILRLMRYTILGLFLYLYLPFMFSQISYTRGFGEQLMEYIMRPILFLWESIAAFLPKLLFIIIIIIAVRYLLKGMEYVARQVRNERIKFAHFYPDWAIPTFNLVKVLIIIFTMVIIFPYLPGAGSDAFQGISVFVGLLLSLGSAGAISNVISGVILTYMRPFKLGDRVKINDITGDVMGKNLLITKIKTPKNEEITIPNANLLVGGIINYTSMAREHGLIINTVITIGYDVPWKEVHRLLIEAATKTEFIEHEPEPFVLQKSLNDWYVAYEINAYTRESHKMPLIYSDLHAHIQDAFNEAGLEIMSAHYTAVRDGNPKAVPENYLPADYKKPGFLIEK